eukprot:1359900-Amphidinium_carterae.1
MTLLRLQRPDCKQQTTSSAGREHGRLHPENFKVSIRVDWGQYGCFRRRPAGIANQTRHQQHG